MANELTVANHYLHRKASTMYAFGLFEGMELVGTIIYGKPASPSLCVGVAGKEESKSVIELTRLWIQDGTPKNTESYLIGQTLRMLPAEHDIIEIGRRIKSAFPPPIRRTRRSRWGKEVLRRKANQV